jgi:hypothetical protein
LLGHAKDRQQVVDRRAGRAVDEMDRAVMRAAIPVFLKDAVGIGGEAAIGEEHRLDPAAQLLVGQEKQAFASSHRRLGCAFGHVPSLPSCRLAGISVTVYVSLVDFPRINC